MVWAAGVINNGTASMLVKRALAPLAAAAVAVFLLPHAASAATPADPRRPGGVDDTPSQVTALAETAVPSSPSLVWVDTNAQTIGFVATNNAPHNVSVYGGYYTDPATGAVISGPYKYIRDESGTPIVAAAQTNGCVQARTMSNGVSVAVPNQVACPYTYGASVYLGDGSDGAATTTGKDCTARKRKKCRPGEGIVAPKVAAIAVAAPAGDDAESAGVVAPQFIDFSGCLFGCGDSGSYSPGDLDFGFGHDRGGQCKLCEWVRRPPAPPAPLPPNAYNVFDKFFAGGNNDTITCVDPDGCWVDGGAGNDTIRPSTSGNDVIAGGPGNDLIDQATSPIPDQFDVIDGGEGNDVIKDPGVGISYGGDGDDTIIAGGTIFGNEGNDTLEGKNLGDRVNIVGGNGSDVIYGGGPHTYANYYDSDQGVNVAIGGGDGVGGTAAGDRLAGDVYGIEGSNGSDNLGGNDNPNSLNGGGGNDYVHGGEGADTVRGGPGSDYVQGEGGKDAMRGDGDGDVLDGGTGDDSIIGGAGGDTLYGGPGADRLNCGAGAGDTVSYSSSASGVTAVIGGGSTKNIGGDADKDTISDTCENLTGSSKNDKLTGDRRSNVLKGGDGNDDIYAQNNYRSHDTVDCGGGSDTVTVDNAFFGGCETIKGTNGPITMKSLAILESADWRNPLTTEPNYGSRNGASSASGAYQYVDSTWQQEAQKIGVDIKKYPSAWMAPPEVQDAVARNNVGNLLTQYGNDITKIPLTWYYPPCARGTVPMTTIPPFPGNTISCQDYVNRFIYVYNLLGPTDMPI